MRNIILFCLTVILYSGCSFKEPANSSQYKMSSTFSSYTNNFLSDNNALAKNDLKQAIKYAKTNADLNQLATIYLGECALNISVGIDDKCKKYKDIEELIDNTILNSYYNLITLRINKEEIDLLPEAYKNFTIYLNTNQFNKAYNEILEMDTISSLLISATLLKDKLTTYQIDEIIEIASFNGYKKSVIFWLNELKNRTDNKIEKEIIKRKIIILESKN
ncbi:MAG: hypothetical protein U9P72_02675 [Campylobacterota bacterium]|nr:hypothetical protein [Campylobacterota bacterium]